MPTKDQESAEAGIAIEAVIFDYGNVISLPQNTADLETMAGICGLPVARFNGIYWKLRLEYDRGQLSGTSYWTSLLGGENRVATPEQISQLIATDIHSWLAVNDAVLQWTERLHGLGIRRAVLSNMPGELARYIEENCGWISSFDTLVFSCDFGVAKPDPAIYQKCLERLDVRPDRVLFLDDRRENVAAAAGMGIHSQVFDNFGNTLRRVEDRFTFRNAVNETAPQPKFSASED